MIIAHWRPLFDPFFANPFIVLPLTGNLLSIDGDLDTFLARRAARVAGLRLDTRKPNEFFSPATIIDTLPGDDAVAPSSLAKPIRAVARTLLKIFPLYVAIRLLSVAFPLKSGGALVLADDALQILVSSFGRRSKDDCLEVALCRYALLRRMGYRCAVCIGLLTPSDEMHAWVAYYGHPVLECEDVLVHYQICLTFVDSAQS